MMGLSDVPLFPRLQEAKVTLNVPGGGHKSFTPTALPSMFDSKSFEVFISSICVHKFLYQSNTDISCDGKHTDRGSWMGVSWSLGANGLYYNTKLGAF